MKHLFIVNPAAGKKDAYHATISHIKESMAALELPYEIYVTRGPMDACEKIKSESKNPEALRVYACGGDGTLNECVNGAAGMPHVSVTHFPCGTGNDFIKMFGPDAGKFRNISALVHGNACPVDLIKVNDRYSINICSVGIDARIGTDVHKYIHIPLIGGSFGYIVSLVVNLVKGITQRLVIHTQDQTYSGCFSLVCACNGRFYGGGFNPVPDAIPDDGIIEFLVIKDMSRLKFLQIVKKYAAGKYKQLSDYITHIRSDAMQIQSETDIAINVDGELMVGKEILFSMHHRGINFVFPSDMIYFTSGVNNMEKIANN